MVDAAEASRYRALAEKARKSAGRTKNPEMKLAYENIALKYDEMALAVEQLLAKQQR